VDINNLILRGGKMAIDPVYGFNLLQSYLSELQQVQAGIPYSALGIGERRERSHVTVFDLQSDSSLKVGEVAREGNVKATDRIAVVNIEGLITADSGMSNIGMRAMGDELLKVKNSVVGALFRINSGGGHMDGAEAMIAAMREFGKPIVSIGGFMGSAAYMIASESDQILAETEFSEFGSIGVFVELNKQMREKYAEAVESIYADTSPDKNEAARLWLKGDSSGFVKIVNDADSGFMKLVSRNRRLSSYGTKTNKTLAGGMFATSEALERGLIDGKSNTEKAFSIIQHLSTKNK
jgi:ClpP class serine protease